MKTYDVIYADPAWKFKTYSAKGMSRSADNHHDTMTVDEIAALDVPAGPHCVLFLWATAPMLLEALHTMKSWGFTYKTQMAWDKRVQATGYYVRNVHEPLLIGTIGKPKLPLPQNRPESLLIERKRQHSRKPECSYRVIEQMYPDASRLEMFSRCHRAGWDAWGNETDKFQQESAA